MHETSGIDIRVFCAREPAVPHGAALKKHLAVLLAYWLGDVDSMNVVRGGCGSVIHVEHCCMMHDA